MNINPISTILKKLIAFENGHLVLEDYYQFKGKSNLYYLKDDSIVWFAQLPEKDDWYVNFDVNRLNAIVAWTFSCYYITINNEGKVIDSVFTK